MNLIWPVRVQPWCGPIGLQRIQPILQHIVHFRHAILNQLIEPLELVVGVGDLAL